ncbi:DNA topoisomerase I, partial [Brevibacterium paucivorans]
APGQAESFAAKLTAVDGQKIAQGRDFTDEGTLKPRTKARILGQQDAEELAAKLSGEAKDRLSVTALETKPYSRRPAAPFTTSTLQQEAGRKLRMSAR